MLRKQLDTIKTYILYNLSNTRINKQEHWNPFNNETIIGAEGFKKW